MTTLFRKLLILGQKGKYLFLGKGIQRRVVIQLKMFLAMTVFHLGYVNKMALIWLTFTGEKQCFSFGFPLAFESIDRSTSSAV